MSFAVGTVPLEAAYLLVAVASMLVGFFAMRWHGLSRRTASFAVAGFLYILARTSFVASLFIVLWRQALRIDVSNDNWQSLAYLIFLVAAFGAMALSGAMMLAAVVFVDKFGSKGETPGPQT